MARARYSEWWSDVGTVFAHRDDRTAVLAALFPDFTIEVFPERHQLDTPHRIEPERLADSLLGLWHRAE